MLLSRVCTSPWYITWDCRLCASGCMALLLREAAGVAIILTGLLWMTSYPASLG